MGVAHAFRAAAAVGKDEIGDPAPSVGAYCAAVLHAHRFEARHGVHDGISGPLALNQHIDDFVAAGRVQEEPFGFLEGRVEIEGYAVDVRTCLYIVQRIGHIAFIEAVDNHVDAYGRQSLAVGGAALEALDVLLEAGEGSLAADFIVEFPDAVHGNPDLVSMAACEGQLGIRGDGDAPETNVMSHIDDIVDGLVPVFPQIELAALEIHDAAAGLVAVLQFGADLLHGLDARVAQLIDRAVLAAQVAAVEYEDDRLQGSPSSEQGPEVPPCRIQKLPCHRPMKKSTSLTAIMMKQKPVLTLRMANHLSR